MLLIHECEIHAKMRADLAALQMAIELSVMRLLDGVEPREVAKGLCAVLAAAIDAAREGK